MYHWKTKAYVTRWNFFVKLVWGNFTMWLHRVTMAAETHSSTVARNSQCCCTSRMLFYFSWNCFGNSHIPPTWGGEFRIDRYKNWLTGCLTVLFSYENLSTASHGDQKSKYLHTLSVFYWKVEWQSENTQKYRHVESAHYPRIFCSQSLAGKRFLGRQSLTVFFANCHSNGNTQGNRPGSPKRNPQAHRVLGSPFAKWIWRNSHCIRKYHFINK